jgi:hypothetical protein
MPVPREEMETVIRLGYHDDELTFSTTNPAHHRHMERLGITPWRTDLHEKEIVSWVYRAPADWFKLPRPKKKVSDEQRQALSERMKARFADDEDEEGSCEEGGPCANQLA